MVSCLVDDGLCTLGTLWHIGNSKSDYCRRARFGPTDSHIQGGPACGYSFGQLEYGIVTFSPGQ